MSRGGCPEREIAEIGRTAGSHAPRAVGERQLRIIADLVNAEANIIVDAPMLVVYAAVMSRFTFSLPTGVTVIVEPQTADESDAILRAILSAAAADALPPPPTSPPPAQAAPTAPVPVATQRVRAVPAGEPTSPRLLPPTMAEVLGSFGTADSRAVYQGIADCRGWTKLADVLDALGRGPRAAPSVINAIRNAAARINVDMTAIIETELRKEDKAHVMYVRVPTALNEVKAQ